ncbi:MAG: hypothetical protein LC777_15720, partial [Actinobacteria bacterium]|nr:hypothetical protein [Actinomycetota bacterium]
MQVDDDRCPNVSSAPTSTTNDNGDARLDPIGANGTGPEVWVFTCGYTMAGEANPVINTATVTALDEFDRPVSDSDDHATTLPQPAIALVKT